MKKELIYNITIIISILLLLSFPAWSVPGLINYQGKLTDPNGVSLDGAYIMKFYLYNVESDGSPLWNEQQDVTVTNGIYNVELGKISSLPLDLFDNEDLFLEVEIFKTVIGWETLSPRQRLTSTPFAMKAASSNIAGDAEKLDGKDSSEFGDGHSLDAADSDPVDVLYVDSNGNVGIGTSSPEAKLHVNGTLKVENLEDSLDCKWSNCIDTGSPNTLICSDLVPGYPLLAGIDIAIHPDQKPAGCSGDYGYDDARIYCCRLK